MAQLRPNILVIWISLSGLRSPVKIFFFQFDSQKLKYIQYLRDTSNLMWHYKAKTSWQRCFQIYQNIKKVSKNYTEKKPKVLVHI